MSKRCYQDISEGHAEIYRILVNDGEFFGQNINTLLNPNNLLPFFIFAFIKFLKFTLCLHLTL